MDSKSRKDTTSSSGDVFADGAIDPTIVDDPVALRQNIGQRVRALRQARSMSVRDLAASADITSGFISQVEHGQAMPSLTSLLRICRALGVTAGDVFGYGMFTGRLVRQDERRVFNYPEEGVRDELLSADASGRLEVIYSVIGPGSGSGALYVHGTDSEVVLVLSGTVEIGLDGSWHRLEPGDSLTLSGATPHGFRNQASEPCELIWIMTPARY